MNETQYVGASAAEREASELGRHHGTAAGSWVIDGNTPDGSLRAIIRTSEEGSFFDLVDPSAPLSGEFADGYSLGQLSDDTGVDEESDEFGDICSAYEDAWYSAFEAEAVRSAIAQLPE